TTRLSTVWSPSPLLVMSTTVTGLLLLAGLSPAGMAASLAARPKPASRTAKKIGRQGQTCSPDCDRLSISRGRSLMRRREFIAGLGGAATAWPLASWAQQGDRVRRIGVIMGGDENDPESKLRYSAFTQALADSGWTDSRNLRIDLRWGGADS